MVWGNFFKRLFSKDEVNVNLSEVHHQEAENKHSQEILDKVNSLSIDLEGLSLEKIESESETINSYLKALMRDIIKYSDLMDNKERQLLTVRAISGKIKVITQHCLELKNLLAHLENRYYSFLIDLLTELNKSLNNDEISVMIQDLEKEKSSIAELDTKLTRIMVYDALFNPDKTAEYEGEIKKEVIKRELHTNINELTSHLLNEIISKSMGLKNKIRKQDYSSKVKSVLNISQMA